MSKRTHSPPTSDPAKLTLLNVLQRRNPDVKDEWAGKTYNNTKSSTGTFDRVLFDDTHVSVRPWTDFTFDAIDLAYGDLLHQRIRDFHLNYEPIRDLTDTHSGTIYDETSVDRLGVAWSHRIVKEPLRAAASRLHPSSGQSSAPTLEHALVSWHDSGKKGIIYRKPDWVSPQVVSLSTLHHYPTSEGNQVVHYLEPNL